MKFESRLFAVLLLICSAVSGPAMAQQAPPWSDPNTVTTVMQFTVKDNASRANLQEALAAIGSYVAKQPTCLENVFMKNTNNSAAPQFIGVARWKSVKDWEALWLDEAFQVLVGRFAEYGTINPGIFSPVER